MPHRRERPVQLLLPQVFLRLKCPGKPSRSPSSRINRRSSTSSTCLFRPFVIDRSESFGSAQDIKVQVTIRQLGHKLNLRTFYPSSNLSFVSMASLSQETRPIPCLRICRFLTRKLGQEHCKMHTTSGSRTHESESSAPSANSSCGSAFSGEA